MDEPDKSLEWKEIGGRIQERLTAQGWTHARLGEALGTSKNDVTQTIGGRPVSEEKLARIADALGVSRAYLRYGVTDLQDAKAITAAAYRDGRIDALDDLIEHIQQIRGQAESARLLALLPETPSDNGAGFDALERTLSGIASEIRIARRAGNTARVADASRQFFETAKAHAISTGKSQETAAYLAELLLTANGGSLANSPQAINDAAETARPPATGASQARIKRR